MGVASPWLSESGRLACGRPRDSPGARTSRCARLRVGPPPVSAVGTGGGRNAVRRGSRLNGVRNVERLEPPRTHMAGYEEDFPGGRVERKDVITLNGRHGQR